MLVKKNSTCGQRLWPWKALIGGVCLVGSNVIALGMRDISNPDGWPEWLFFPGVVLAVVGGVLVYAEWREGSL
nr:MAG TPA: hypothetical protein [Caudoviricetes sp.]